MGIRPVLSSETDRRSPELVRLILTQLEMIKLSNNLSTDKILASFYDLENPELFEEKWNHTFEKKVASLKVAINSGEFKVSQETDTRVLCQLLLDFFEELVEPAISELTISNLSRLTHSGMSSHEILNDQLAHDKLSTPRDAHSVHLRDHRK
jgi:hypothetical protein